MDTDEHGHPQRGRTPVIALDTNVLVRFLVEDDAAQTRRAKSLIQKTQATTTCYISDVVVCELVWVLTSCYRVPRAEIAQILRRLTASRQMTFDATDRITRALDAFTTSRGDFADTSCASMHAGPAAKP